MAVGIPFNSATKYLAGNVSGQAISFLSDTFKFMLTNTAPNISTAQKYSDISGIEIAAGNGYTAGGETSAVTVAQSSGQANMTFHTVTWLAAGGDIGPFRYVVLYDDTPTDKPLLVRWDRGASFTITDTNSFTLLPGSSSPTGLLLQLL